MTETPLTILAVFAHPDDEIGVGSTLAYYASKGVRTVLACATRGEAATIFCDGCATPDNLAAVRTQELQCACEHLGISELRWIDWPDGRINQLPRDAAVAQVVRLIRDVRPFVVLTHPENGLYPHPDHLAVFEIVRRAFDLAVDPRQFPGAVPWGPIRLFTRAMPQSYFERAPGLADFRVELNGQLLPFMGTPDDQIDVTMRVEAFVEKRMAAWDCHRSQHNPKGFSTVMPDGLRREMAANEDYLLVASRLPLPGGVRDDLLAGLWREAPVAGPAAPAREQAQEPAAGAERSSRLASRLGARIVQRERPVRVQATPAEEVASEVNSGGAAVPAVPESVAPAGSGDDPTVRLVGRLERELAAHLTLTDVLKAYGADVREAKAGPLYRELADGEQEIVYRLARTLRQAGGSPGKITADERAVNSARRKELTEERMAYLRDQYTAAHERLNRRVAESMIVEERAVWQELLVMMRSQLDSLFQ